jgi:hypothetical protein
MAECPGLTQNLPPSLPSSLPPSLPPSPPPSFIGPCPCAQIDPDFADRPAPPPGAKSEAPYYDFDARDDSYEEDEEEDLEDMAEPICDFTYQVGLPPSLPPSLPPFLPLSFPAGLALSGDLTRKTKAPTPPDPSLPRLPLPVHQDKTFTVMKFVQPYFVVGEREAGKEGAWELMVGDKAEQVFDWVLESGECGNPPPFLSFPVVSTAMFPSGFFFSSFTLFLRFFLLPAPFRRPSV